MDRILNAVGLKLGDFDLDLERHDWHPGERIRGVFQFKLKKIVKARSVRVGVRAYRSKLDAEHPPEFEFEKTIAKAGKYFEESFPFELLIPKDAGDPGGVVGQLGKAMSFLKNPKSPLKPLKWELWAKLDISMQASPEQIVRIQVTPGNSRDSRRSNAKRESNPDTGFYDYSPPELPLKRKAKAATPTEDAAPKTEAPGESSTPPTSEKQEKKSSSTPTEKPKEKPKKPLRHYAPPALEKPSRLKLPEPSYDELPKHERKGKKKK